MTNAALFSSRAVLRVSGPDAQSFLQGILTQDVETLAPGEAAFSALLTPQGKILFDFILVADGEGFLLDCDRAGAEGLAKRLTLYRLRANVTIAREEDFAVAAWWDGAAPPHGGEEAISVPDPRLAALGRRIIGKAESVAALAGGGAAAGEAAYDAHRIGHGVPEFGKDFASDEVFLLDVGYDALHGVSYKKGCFVGQEVTSRMKRKGDIRKRTLKLVFDGAPPEKGAAVRAGDSTLGEVLSGGEGAALALIRLDRLAAARTSGARLEAAGKPVQIVFPDWLKQV